MQSKINNKKKINSKMNFHFLLNIYQLRFECLNENLVFNYSNQVKTQNKTINSENRFFKYKILQY